MAGSVASINGQLLLFHGSSLADGCITVAVTTDTEQFRGNVNARIGTRDPVRNHRSLRRRPPPRAPAVVREAGLAGLHRRLVGRDRWDRRVHAIGPGRGVDAEPPAGDGHHPRLYPRPGPVGPERRRHGRSRPGPVRLRAGHVVQRDRGALERHRVHRALQAGPGHHPLPEGRPWPGRRSTRPTRRSSTWVPPGAVRSRAAPPSSWPPCAPACSAWPGGRPTAPSSTGCRPTTWPRSSPTWVPGKDIAARIFVCPVRGHRYGAGHRPAHDRRLPQCGGVRPVPPLVGTGRSVAAHVVGVAGGGPERRPGRHPRRGGRRLDRARVRSRVPRPHPALRGQRGDHPGHRAHSLRGRSG